MDQLKGGEQNGMLGPWEGDKILCSLHGKLAPAKMACPNREKYLYCIWKAKRKLAGQI